IIEQIVKVNQKAHILELKQRNQEEHCYDNLYAVSIKEDTTYPYPKLHSASTKRRSIRRLTASLSSVYQLVCVNHPDLSLVFDLEDQCEEEVAEAMGEPTIEEYMTKTREDYGSVCDSCGGPHYTKDCPLKEEGKTLEEAYYTQFGVPFPQGGRYRAAALGFYQRDNGNPSRLIDDSYEEKEVLGELIYRRESAINLKRLLREKPRMGTIKRPEGIVENVLVGIDKFAFAVDFIVLDMPEDIKVPLILGRPFLSTHHAKIDVFKKKIALRIGNDKIVFKSDNPTSNIIKRVYALGLRERMELDLEARLIGEALNLNR
ncbi:putative reverse transcriptase domain-containing protein, partial [Tanacetum coccineum]